MPVLRHHSHRPFPHFGEYLLALAMPPSSQGIVSPAIPGRFTGRGDWRSSGLPRKARLDMLRE